MSPFDMLSSDFIAPFFVFFFFILALESIGLLVFMESWPGGLVVWAEAADTLPTKATQHAAMSKFRILISCWNKRPKRMKSRDIGSMDLAAKFGPDDGIKIAPVSPWQICAFGNGPLGALAAANAVYGSSCQRVRMRARSGGMWSSATRRSVTAR